MLLSFSFLFFLSFDMFFYLSWRHFASLRVICAIFNISPSLKKCKWSFSLFSSTSVPVEMDCIADMLYPSILFLHLSYMVYYLHAMLSGRVDPHLAVCNMLLENENHESEMPCGSFQLTKMSINNRVVHTGVYFSHLCANALPCSKITRCPLTVIHHFFCRADQMCFLWRRVWPFALRPPNQNASSVDQKKQAAEQELDATNSGSGFTLWPRATCVTQLLCSNWQASELEPSVTCMDSLEEVKWEWEDRELVIGMLCLCIRRQKLSVGWEEAGRREERWMTTKSGPLNLISLTRETCDQKP